MAAYYCDMGLEIRNEVDQGKMIRNSKFNIRNEMDLASRFKEK